MIQVNGKKHAVHLNRIHLEEDAGKSIHDIDQQYTSVDYNRAGVALVEIVTEPCIHSAEEAYAYLTELRKLVRYLDVCDGNMEEGSLRCDANISIRPIGSDKLGTRVEVKNLNSIRNVKKAIEAETARMILLARSGKSIEQQTRGFDATNQTTFALRTKEEANDYRYFADPDLSPFSISDSFLNTIKQQLPELPQARIKRYMEQLHLSEYDAHVISDDKEFGDYFDQLVLHTGNHKAAVNWMIGPVRSWLNDKQTDISVFPVKAVTLSALIALIDKGGINFSVAASKLFPELVNHPGSDPEQLAISMNLVQDADTGSITTWVDEVLRNMPEKVLEFKKGKKGLIGLFVGEVKRVSKGKADPKLTTDILLQKLQQ
jgi:aspartyl-tRNA(Asn)/glutamyl-tRNA(Gln) amidotransferase subunit B